MNIEDKSFGKVASQSTKGLETSVRWINHVLCVTRKSSYISVFKALWMRVYVFVFLNLC